MSRWLTSDRSYYRDLVWLALPVAAQGLIAFLATFADNLMVSSLGDGAVSGVYFASQVNILVQMFASGLATVIVILSAQYWGRGDTDTIKTIMAIGVRLSALVGGVIAAICLLFPAHVLAIFTSDAAAAAQGTTYLRIVCLSYVFFCLTQALLGLMRAVETTVVGMAISLISLVIHVSLNAWFIFGLHWGVAGAAWSMVLARAGELVAIGFYVLRMDAKLRVRLGDVTRRSPLILHDFGRYGAPLVAGELVWSINLMVNSIVFGHFFDAAVATAVSIANTMATLAFITLSGMAAAVGVITGKTVGAGRVELMKEHARTTQVIFLVVGLLTGVLVAGLNLPFVSLYAHGISPEAAAQARVLIWVLAVTIVGSGYQMPVLFGLVKSGGDISFVFKNDTIFVFGVVLPSAIISAFLGAPAWWVFACLKSDQILKCFVAVVKVNRFNWMKNLTRDREVVPIVS